MPSIGSNSKPAYVYDAGTDTWIPIGPGEHTHDYIGKDVITTTGDLIYASAANTPARRGIGSTGQVLTVSGGLPVWAAPAAGGKVLQVVQGTTTTNVISSVTSFADTGLTATITPTATTSKILVLISHPQSAKSNGNTSNALQFRLMRDATSVVTFNTYLNFTNSLLGVITAASFNYLDNPATTSATTYKTQFANQVAAAEVSVQHDVRMSTITLMEIGA